MKDGHITFPLPSRAVLLGQDWMDRLPVHSKEVVCSSVVFSRVESDSLELPVLWACVGNWKAVLCSVSHRPLPLLLNGRSVLGVVWKELLFSVFVFCKFTLCGVIFILRYCTELGEEIACCFASSIKLWGPEKASVNVMNCISQNGLWVPFGLFQMLRFLADFALGVNQDENPAHCVFWFIFHISVMTVANPALAV